ncbi:hypothetical protein [Streptomyces sp. AM 2-1-1]|uniref:hypothetical protein n=1 Tax=Streptomyces sp. AM 2-1-1 TaxID=3028709 RepID=UPI0023B8FBE8|nr:hypothetical protein [Streptomyces sp. AM 2-1-1]WEH42967.1 hypothetical protein PZB77_27625 [Streptomyces sp. AM 2-1-1]
MSAPEASENTDLLGIYLNDHHTGATGGLELFRRAAKTRPDAREAAVLADLARQVDEDRDALSAIMKDLGIPVSGSKAALGWVAEKAGRLKPNGHLLSRSPLSDVVEAESMLLGVLGKAACWRTLRALAESDERLSAGQLDALVDRAERQSAALEELRAATAARTLSSRPADAR